VSIYQAGEQLYDLFDKVCVIAEGRMVYFGPAKAARQYFIDIGYEPHNRQTTADFLVAGTFTQLQQHSCSRSWFSVTDPIGRRIRPGFEGTVPRTAAQMAAHFKASQLGQLNRQAVEEYRALHVGKPDHKASYRQSALMEHSRHAPKSNPYTISIPMQVRAVMVRRVQIIRGDMTAQVVQLMYVFHTMVMIATS
jgi:ATP-binding cassette subfamily G (WHITE) protein 2 (SNQ2)